MGIAGGMQNATSPGNMIVDAAAIGAAPFTGGLSLLAPPAVGAMSGAMHNGLGGAVGGAAMGSGASLGGGFIGASAIPAGTDMMGMGALGASQMTPNLMGMINQPPPQSNMPPQMPMTDNSAMQFFNSPNGQNY